MEIRLKRQLSIAAILLAWCVIFAGLMIKAGCSGTVVNVGGNVTQLVADGEGEVNADSAQVEQTDGGTSLGNPLQTAEPEAPEPQEQQPTLDE